MRRAEEEQGKERPVVVFSDYVVADKDLVPLPVKEENLQVAAAHTELSRLLVQNYITGCTMMLNRKAVEMAGKYDERILMHDWWMAAAAARFGRIVYLDEPLGTYRQHGENAVGAKHVGSVEYRWDRLGRLEEVRETIRRKKEQAACFREVYRDKLTGEDVLFLEGYEKEKSGIGFYLKYGGLIHGAERKLGFALLG
jgi:hypothetical protein